MGNVGDEMNPVGEISRFLDELKSKGLLAPVCLSTVGFDETPNSRFVDLKEILDGTLLFGTDERSVKAREFETNPAVALSGWWDPIQTQIRVRGTIARAPTAISDRIFAQRGQSAKALASVSVQSSELSDREAFRTDLTSFLREHHGVIPRPESWHVYAVIPYEIEILSFSEDRVHHRTRFTKNANGWTATDLYP
jgi:pyridoxamine 5'-phosphate oxidase